MIRRKAKRPAKKLLEDKAPKVIENPKKSLILRGRKLNKTLHDLLKDINSLRQPNSINFLQQSHDLVPFDEVQPTELLIKRQDTSLFVIGSNTKKRPNNLIMGRCFNYQILDMIEFGLTDINLMAKKSSVLNALGSKPCILFKGDEFLNNEDFKMLRNLFLDFFNLEKAEEINLLGLDHVVCLTAIDAKHLHFSHYKINLQKSGQKAPKVELVDIGPSFRMEIRRIRWGADDLRKQAMKVPVALQKGKNKLKNVYRDELNNVRARIHVEQEDISSIRTQRPKALQKKVGEDTEKKVEQLKLFLHGKRKFKQQQAADSNGSANNSTAAVNSEPTKKKVKQQ
ncbi:hypothetical protein ABK040_012593 [Willaertia magna]